MGKALDYTLANWPLLEVYLHDSRIEIDNNSVENAIRPTALGKKNCLFIGAAEAGQRSAIPTAAWAAACYPAPLQRAARSIDVAAQNYDTYESVKRRFA